MTQEITNESQFSEAVNNLSVEQQRAVGALFVENVQELNSDPRIDQTLEAAKNTEISEEQLNMVRRVIKAAALEAHTRCGAEGDWLDQAAYFVARAAEACVEAQVRTKGKGPAWKAAAAARMARTCLATDSGEDAHGTERHDQYKILTDYLNS